MSRTQPPACRPVELPDRLDELGATSALLGGPRLDLSDSALRDGDWGGRMIDELRLEACLLEKAQAPDIGIGEAKWLDVRWSKCDLSNAEIHKLEAVRVEFRDCRMTGIRCWETKWEHLRIAGGTQKYAQFRFARFLACEFDGCDFEDADFYGADLRDCRFQGCNLRNVEMTTAQLEGADLRGSRIDGLRVAAGDVRGAIVDAAQALELAPLLGIRIEE